MTSTEEQGEKMCPSVKEKEEMEEDEKAKEMVENMLEKEEEMVEKMLEMKEGVKEEQVVGNMLDMEKAKEMGERMVEKEEMVEKMLEMKEGEEEQVVGIMLDMEKAKEMGERMLEKEEMVEKMLEMGEKEEQVVGNMLDMEKAKEMEGEEMKEEEGKGDTVEKTPLTSEKIGKNSKKGPLPEKKQAAEGLNLNNEVVNMRKEVKRVRTLVLRKMTRQMSALKKKKGNEAELERNRKRAGRLLEEIHAMNALKPDEVSKTALRQNLSFEKVCKDPSSTIADRAMARIASHPQFSKKIDAIKAAVEAFKEERGEGGKKGEKKGKRMRGKKKKKTAEPQPKDVGSGGKTAEEDGEKAAPTDEEADLYNKYLAEMRAKAAARGLNIFQSVTASVKNPETQKGIRMLGKKKTTTTDVGSGGGRTAEEVKAVRREEDGDRVGDADGASRTDSESAADNDDVPRKRDREKAAPTDEEADLYNRYLAEMRAKAATRGTASVKNPETQNPETHNLETQNGVGKAPQSRAAEEKPSPTPAPAKRPRKDDDNEEESDLEPCDDEGEKEYFDDSTEERFRKQSSQSGNSDDEDDFFLGKVSKLKKKKKKKKNSNLVITVQGKPGSDPADPLQRDLDELESRLNSAKLKTAFCSSLSESHTGGGGQSWGGGGQSWGGRGRGRGRGQYGGGGGQRGGGGSRDRFSNEPPRSYKQHRGMEGRPGFSNDNKRYSKDKGGESRDRDAGFAGRGRGQGRGRGRGDMARQQDRFEAPQQSLHPSWEASKRKKEQQGIMAFQGKKIKFDD